MSLALDMIRAAARTRTARPDAARAAARFFRAAALPDGGFPDRGGRADLYFTVFGLMGLAALDAAPSGPAADAHAAYLAGFGNGSSLDFVHAACLARAWAVMRGAPPPQVAAAVLAQADAHRAADGGYNAVPRARSSTAYGCFLAVGAREDCGGAEPDPDAVARALGALVLPDGGYANTRGLPVGAAPATAAAVVTLAALGRDVPDAATRWLLAQQKPRGGWPAMPGLPADLLSTATALHALAAARAAPDAAAREACAAYVADLQAESGGFLGHEADTAADVEYTFYGLIAMGHAAP